MTTHLAWLVPALALSLPMTALAQGDPTDPKTPARPLRHPSAFSDYKPWQETQRGDWRQLNDSVRPAAKDAAGHPHRGHGSAPAAPNPAASAPAMPAHRRHSMHGGKP